MPRPKDPAKRPLTLKEKKLVANVLKTGKKAQSAIDAGYSPKSAGQIASETLRKPNVQAAVQSAAEKLGINPEYVLGGFKEIADFNKKTFSRKVKKVVGEGDDAKIEEIEEIKMIDPQASLRAHEMLGKHLKLFTETVELNAKVEQTIDDKTLKLNLARKIASLLQNPDLN